MVPACPTAITERETMLIKRLNMRKLLDIMFRNKKLSILIPVLSALVVYILFILFGNVEDKIRIVAITPILSAIWFFGVFLILYIQVKNTACPEWFLNLIELSLFVFSEAYALIGTVLFLIGGLQNFNPGLCMSMVAGSSIAWVHSKRQV